MSAVELSLTEIMDKVVVDDWGQCSTGELGALRAHVQTGRLTRETLHAELCEIVVGDRPGRESAHETILFWHRGLSLSDIALAHALLGQADRQGNRNKPAIRVILDGHSLTPAAVTAVARACEHVELDAAARGRVERDRAVVEDAIARQLPVYGLTTGLGARAGFVLPAEELASFSVRTVRGRANAVGPPLPRDVVRAALLVRCNGMAHGGSGIQPVVLELLLAMLTIGVHPHVPETGSIGASDLGQMAHIALVAMGEGRAEYRGELLPAQVALQRAGLKAAVLGPKDGLALCNSSALSAGVAALAYDEARKLLATAQLVTTLSFEGFRASTTPLDPRVQASRPLAGARKVRGPIAPTAGRWPAARWRQLLAAFRIRSASAAPPTCMARFTRQWGCSPPRWDPELNGAGDNPLVLGEDREILSTGNFNTAALALALDTLALAIFQTASICAQRTQRR